MPLPRSRFAVAAVVLLIASTFSAVALVSPPATPVTAPAGTVAAAEPTAETKTIEGHEGVPIEVTIFKPATASADEPVPVLLHGHGWGGEGWDDVGQAQPYLEAGYGVVSIDQRGHGNSGGRAQVMSPEAEAEDVQAVIDHVAGLDWVETEGTSNDPVLGAMGGSYGGAYQLVTALDEKAEMDGSTRLDALAPGITWYNLTRSLAPDGVVKSEWVDLLVAIAKAPPRTDTHPEFVDKPYAYTKATGDLPDGTAPGFVDVGQAYYERSPASFVDGAHSSSPVQLDIPALFQQGMSDTLFPLNQAVNNLELTLTDAAADDSYIVGHTTGHVLPSFGPPQGRLQEAQGGGTPCADEVAGSSTDLLVNWFDHTLKGASDDGLPDDRITVPTESGDCLGFQDLPDASAQAQASSQTVTVSGPAPSPTLVPIQQGPATVAGIPTFNATAQTTSVDARVLVGLAVGPNEAEAHVVDSQWRPLRFEGPTTGTEVQATLPGVAVDVAEDETLYVAVTGSNDMYNQHGSRTPGPVVLDGIQVDLPVASS
jgi:pimeloyl-ACP methyl ester carboxylesterase